MVVYPICSLERHQKNISSRGTFEQTLLVRPAVIVGSEAVRQAHYLEQRKSFHSHIFIVQARGTYNSVPPQRARKLQTKHPVVAELTRMPSSTSSLAVLSSLAASRKSVFLSTSSPSVQRSVRRASVSLFCSGVPPNCTAAARARLCAHCAEKTQYIGVESW